MGEVVKGFDAVNYYDSDGNHMTAYKGEKLASPKDGEVDRLKKLGAFGDAEPAAAELTTPAGDPANVTESDDDDLSKMGVDELRVRAGAQGIQGVESMKKADLVKALRDTAERSGPAPNEE